MHNRAAEQKIYDRSGVYRPLGHPARCVQFCFSSPICLSNIEEFAGVCLSSEHALCQVEPPLPTTFHRVSLRRNHTMFSVVLYVVPLHTFIPCPRLYHLYVLLSTRFLFAGITPCSQLFLTLFLSTPSHRVVVCFVTLSIIRTLSKCCFRCSSSPSLYFVTLSLNVACFVAPRLDLR